VAERGGLEYYILLNIQKAESQMNKRAVGYIRVSKQNEKVLVETLLRDWLRTPRSKDHS
jgi:hypothetical protein